MIVGTKGKQKQKKRIWRGSMASKGRWGKAIDSSHKLSHWAGHGDGVASTSISVRTVAYFVVVVVVVPEGQTQKEAHR